jgi:NAD+ kinase
VQVVVVYKKSQLRLALEKRNNRIKRLLKRGDPSVLPMQAAHDAHEATLAEVQRALKAAKITAKTVYRASLRSKMTEGRLVVSVGGDGTLLDASHKIRASHVLGVNSDTAHSVGFLCAAHRGTFAAQLDEILSGKWQPTPLRRIHGAIDDEPLPFPVLNDVLMAHKNPAATSRYLIEHKGVVEDHKSSGIWMATAAGSTAAMASAGGDVVDIDDERCQMRVREPFVADGPLLQLAQVWLKPDDDIVVASKMREGRVYLDGPHEILELPMGARLSLHGRAPPLHLFATSEMKARRDVARKNAARR